jgi:predicted enzyme related to lactoylglutathione lyase
VSHPGVKVLETFFSVAVTDMRRATSFYVAALEAQVAFASPGWSSLMIAGVRVGLALVPEHTPSRTGLHFTVGDLSAARDAIARAGGRNAGPPNQVAPGVIVSDAVDSEGNTFTLTSR